MKKYLILLLNIYLSINFAYSQESKFPFRIRTITAGVTLKSLSDTTTLIEAIDLLRIAKKVFTNEGYEVQTLRIATSNLYNYLNGTSLKDALPFLKTFDKIAISNDVILSIGQVLAPDKYETNIAAWATDLVRTTNSISFSLPISSHQLGIHTNSIKASAEIIAALSKENKGEANFRFTASANCPSGIPFFPAAFHQGGYSFAIGLESPNLLIQTFKNSDKNNARLLLKTNLEKHLRPVQSIAEKIGESTGWTYDGIDVSPAPGLDASIGYAIETYTKQPFGSSSTLAACAMITDVLKSLDIKKCGYSGLMLPVIEDTVLARRAIEERYTVKELLLYSSVSGTGLDVIPIAGDTRKEIIASILTDVAALSLKYTAKALSVRLFPIPGKKAGDKVSFANPFLTSTRVMKVD